MLLVFQSNILELFVIDGFGSHEYNVCRHDRFRALLVDYRSGLLIEFVAARQEWSVAPRSSARGKSVGIDSFCKPCRSFDA